VGLRCIIPPRHLIQCVLAPVEHPSGVLAPVEYPSGILAPVEHPIGVLAPTDFLIIWFSNLLIKLFLHNYYRRTINCLLIYISYEKLQKDGKVLCHLKFMSKVLPGPLRMENQIIKKSVGASTPRGCSTGASIPLGYSTGASTPLGCSTGASTPI
jgi:hypothetical protein